MPGSSSSRAPRSPSTCSSSKVEITLRADDGGTEVALCSEQTLRGLSRLGSPMMRGGQGRILDEALNGLERALGPGED